MNERILASTAALGSASSAARLAIAATVRMLVIEGLVATSQSAVWATNSGTSETFGRASSVRAITSAAARP
jgi:hypothetical protein